MLKSRSIQKLIAILTVVAFCFTQNGIALPTASPEVILPKHLQLGNEFLIDIPQDFGRIEKSHISDLPAKPIVFHIQTAHGHYEAQKNIESILGYLKQEHDLTHLLLEGEAFELDPNRLNFISENPKKNYEGLDFLARHAVIKASELHLFNYPDTKTHGIENIREYILNGQAYADVLWESEKSESFLRKVEESVTQFSSYLLNSQLKSFLRTRASFSENTLSFENWIDYLVSHSKKYLNLDLSEKKHQVRWPMMIRLLTLKYLSERFNSRNFSTEREMFIKDVKRFIREEAFHETLENLLHVHIQGSLLSSEKLNSFIEEVARKLPRTFDYSKYPQVKNHIARLLLESELDPKYLMVEMNRLEEKILEHLSRTSQEKKLVEVLNAYELLKKLFALEVTPSEYERILKGKETYRPIALAREFEVLNEGGRVKGVDFSALSDLDTLYERTFDFYALVKKRDEIMIQNAEKKLLEISNNQEKPLKAAIITGGFHAEPFSDFFTSENFSYFSVIPQITSKDEAGLKAYKQLVMNEFGRKAKESTWMDLRISGKTTPPSHRDEMTKHSLGLLGLLSETRRDLSLGKIAASSEGRKRPELDSIAREALEKAVPIMKKAVVEAGKIAVSEKAAGLEVIQDDQAKPLDVVTTTDPKVQQYLISQFEENFDFPFTVVAEESKEGAANQIEVINNKNTGADFEIVIDPIDGTNQFREGTTLYGVSAALKYQGEVIASFFLMPEHEYLIGEQGVLFEASELSEGVTVSTLDSEGNPQNPQKRLPGDINLEGVGKPVLLMNGIEPEEFSEQTGFSLENFQVFTQTTTTSGVLAFVSMLQFEGPHVFIHPSLKLWDASNIYFIEKMGGVSLTEKEEHTFPVKSEELTEEGRFERYTIAGEPQFVNKLFTQSEERFVIHGGVDFLELEDERVFDNLSREALIKLLPPYLSSERDNTVDAVGVVERSELWNKNVTWVKNPFLESEETSEDFDFEDLFESLKLPNAVWFKVQFVYFKSMVQGSGERQLMLAVVPYPNEETIPETDQLGGRGQRFKEDPFGGSEGGDLLGTSETRFEVPEKLTAVEMDSLPSYGEDMKPAFHSESRSENFDRTEKKSLQIGNDETQNVVFAIDYPKDEGPRPVAFIFHGYGQGKDRDIYLKMADRFLDRGYIVVRTDFRNNQKEDGPPNESSSDIKKFTFRGALEDADHVVRYIRDEIENADLQKTTFVGHSMGSWVARKLGAEISGFDGDLRESINIDAMIDLSGTIHPDGSIFKLLKDNGETKKFDALIPSLRSDEVMGGGFFGDYVYPVPDENDGKVATEDLKPFFRAKIPYIAVYGEKDDDVFHGRIKKYPATQQKTSITNSETGGSKKGSVQVSQAVRSFTNLLFASPTSDVLIVEGMEHSYDDAPQEFIFDFIFEKLDAALAGISVETPSEEPQSVSENKIPTISKDEDLSVVFPHPAAINEETPEKAKALYKKYPDIVQPIYSEALEVLNADGENKYSLDILLFGNFDTQDAGNPANRVLENVAPATFLYEVALYRVLENQLGRKFKPRYLGGLSLGAFSAVVLSGAVSVKGMLAYMKSAIELIDQKNSSGEVPPLGFVMVKGLGRDVVEDILQEDNVSVVSDMAPGMVTLAVNLQGMGRSKYEAEAARYQELILNKLPEKKVPDGAKVKVVFPATIGFHHEFLGEDVETALNELVDAMDVGDPSVPVLDPMSNAGNVSVGREGIKDILKLSLIRPVYYGFNIQRMNDGGTVHFLELGPGRYLSTFNDQILPESSSIVISDDARLQQLVKSLSQSETRKLTREIGVLDSAPDYRVTYFEKRGKKKVLIESIPVAWKSRVYPWEKRTFRLKDDFDFEKDFDSLVDEMRGALILHQEKNFNPFWNLKIFMHESAVKYAYRSTIFLWDVRKSFGNLWHSVVVENLRKISPPEQLYAIVLGASVFFQIAAWIFLPQASIFIFWFLVPAITAFIVWALEVEFGFMGALNAYGRNWTDLDRGGIDAQGFQVTGIFTFLGLANYILGPIYLISRVYFSKKTQSDSVQVTKSESRKIEEFFAEVDSSKQKFSSTQWVKRFRADVQAINRYGGMYAVEGEVGGLEILATSTRHVVDESSSEGASPLSYRYHHKLSYVPHDDAPILSIERKIGEPYYELVIRELNGRVISRSNFQIKINPENKKDVLEVFYKTFHLHGVVNYRGSHFRQDHPRGFKIVLQRLVESFSSVEVKNAHIGESFYAADHDVVIRQSQKGVFLEMKRQGILPLKKVIRLRDDFDVLTEGSSLLSEISKMLKIREGYVYNPYWKNLDDLKEAVKDDLRYSSRSEKTLKHIEFKKRRAKLWDRVVIKPFTNLNILEQVIVVGLIPGFFTTLLLLSTLEWTALNLSLIYIAPGVLYFLLTLIPDFFGFFENINQRSDNYWNREVRFSWDDENDYRSLLGIVFFIAGSFSFPVALVYFLILRPVGVGIYKLTQLIVQGVEALVDWIQKNPPKGGWIVQSRPDMKSEDRKPLGHLRGEEFLEELQKTDPSRFKSLMEFYNEKGFEGRRFVLPVDHPAWEHFGGDFRFDGRFDISVSDIQRSVMKALKPHTGGNIISIAYQLGRMKKGTNDFISFSEIEEEFNGQTENALSYEDYIKKFYDEKIHLDPQTAQDLEGQYLVAQWDSLNNPMGDPGNRIGSKELLTAGDDYLFDLQQLAKDIPQIKMLKVAAFWDPYLGETHEGILNFFEEQMEAAHDAGLLAFVENLPPASIVNEDFKTRDDFETDDAWDDYQRGKAMWMLQIAVSFTRAVSEREIDADVHKALLPIVFARNSKGEPLIHENELDAAIRDMTGYAWRPIGWMSAGVPDLAAAVNYVTKSSKRQNIDMPQSGFFPGRSVFLPVLAEIYQEIEKGTLDPKDETELLLIIEERLIDSQRQTRQVLDDLYVEMGEMGPAHGLSEDEVLALQSEDRDEESVHRQMAIVTLVTVLVMGIIGFLNPAVYVSPQAVADFIINSFIYIPLFVSLPLSSMTGSDESLNGTAVFILSVSVALSSISLMPMAAAIVSQAIGMGDPVLLHKIFMLLLSVPVLYVIGAFFRLTGNLFKEAFLLLLFGRDRAALDLGAQSESRSIKTQSEQREPFEGSLEEFDRWFYEGDGKEHWEFIRERKGIPAVPHRNDYEKLGWLERAIPIHSVPLPEHTLAEHSISPKVTPHIVEDNQPAWMFNDGEDGQLVARIKMSPGNYYRYLVAGDAAAPEESLLIPERNVDLTLTDTKANMELLQFHRQTGLEGYVNSLGVGLIRRLHSHVTDWMLPINHLNFVQSGSSVEEDVQYGRMHGYPGSHFVLRSEDDARLAQEMSKFAKVLHELDVPHIAFFSEGQVVFVLRDHDHQELYRIEEKKLGPQANGKVPHVTSLLFGGVVIYDAMVSANLTNEDIEEIIRDLTVDEGNEEIILHTFKNYGKFKKQITVKKLNPEVEKLQNSFSSWWASLFESRGEEGILKSVEKARESNAFFGSMTKVFLLVALLAATFLLTYYLSLPLLHEFSAAQSDLLADQIIMDNSGIAIDHPLHLENYQALQFRLAMVFATWGGVAIALISFFSWMVYKFIRNLNYAKRAGELIDTYREPISNELYEKNLDVALRELDYLGQDFNRFILQDPYLLENYRLSDYVREHYETITPNILMQVLVDLYPEGNETEFVSVYEPGVKGVELPEPIGVSSKNHIEAGRNNVISRLISEKGMNLVTTIDISTSSEERSAMNVETIRLENDVWALYRFFGTLAIGFIGVSTLVAAPSKAILPLITLQSASWLMGAGYGLLGLIVMTSIFVLSWTLVRNSKYQSMKKKAALDHQKRQRAIESAFDLLEKDPEKAERLGFRVYESNLKSENRIDGLLAAELIKSLQEDDLDEIADLVSRELMDRIAEDDREMDLLDFEVLNILGSKSRYQDKRLPKLGLWVSGLFAAVMLGRVIASLMINFTWDQAAYLWPLYLFIGLAGMMAYVFYEKLNDYERFRFAYQYAVEIASNEEATPFDDEFDLKVEKDYQDLLALAENSIGSEIDPEFLAKIEGMYDLQKASLSPPARALLIALTYKYRNVLRYDLQGKFTYYIDLASQLEPANLSAGFAEAINEAISMDERYEYLIVNDLWEIGVPDIFYSHIDLLAETLQSELIIKGKVRWGSWIYREIQRLKRSHMNSRIRFEEEEVSRRFVGPANQPVTPRFLASAGFLSVFLLTFFLWPQTLIAWVNYAGYGLMSLTSIMFIVVLADLWRTQKFKSIYFELQRALQSEQRVEIDSVNDAFENADVVAEVNIKLGDFVETGEGGVEIRTAEVPPSEKALLPIHKHPHDEYYLILDDGGGEGAFIQIDGVSAWVKTGDIIRIPQESEHTIWKPRGKDARPLKLLFMYEAPYERELVDKELDLQAATSPQVLGIWNSGEEFPEEFINEGDLSLERIHTGLGVGMGYVSDYPTQLVFYIQSGSGYITVDDGERIEVKKGDGIVIRDGHDIHIEGLTNDFTYLGVQAKSSEERTSQVKRFIADNQAVMALTVLRTALLIVPLLWGLGFHLDHFGFIDAAIISYLPSLLVIGAFLILLVWDAKRALGSNNKRLDGKPAFKDSALSKERSHDYKDRYERILNLERTGAEYLLGGALFFGLALFMFLPTFEVWSVSEYLFDISILFSQMLYVISFMAYSTFAFKYFYFPPEPRLALQRLSETRAIISFVNASGREPIWTKELILQEIHDRDQVLIQKDLSGIREFQLSSGQLKRALAELEVTETFTYDSLREKNRGEPDGWGNEASD